MAPERDAPRSSPPTFSVAFCFIPPSQDVIFSRRAAAPSLTDLGPFFVCARVIKSCLQAVVTQVGALLWLINSGTKIVRNASAIRLTLARRPFARLIQDTRLGLTCRRNELHTFLVNQSRGTGLAKVLVSGVGALAIVLCATGVATAGKVLRIGDSVVKWPSAVAGPTVITFAMPTSRFSVAGTRKTLSRDNCGSMQPFSHIIKNSPAISQAKARGALRAAFSAWEKIANISFKEVTDVGKANIIVGASVAHHGRAFANLSYTVQSSGKRMGHATASNALGGSGMRPSARSSIVGRSGKLINIEQAYICLSPSKRWKIAFDGNLKVYDLRYTFTHEIGHAIGLDHPGKTGAVMGYGYDERVQEFQKSDIAAVRFLYGPRRLTDAVADLPVRPRK